MRPGRDSDNPEPGAPSSSPPLAGIGLPRPELIAAIPRLRRYARVLVRDPAGADDLVQDTLTRAWEKRRLWRAGSDLRAWLFTVMHNVFVNQLSRSRRDARNVSLDTDGQDGGAFEIQAYHNHLDRIEIHEVARQMDRLPREQREVLVLAAVEELSYGEIAVILGIPIGTVMSRLSRARDKLRRMMNPAAAGKVVE